MGRPSRLSEPGLILHCFNRGVNGMRIFRHDEDYSRFMRFLKAIKDRSPFDLLAYCLMPNHFHLLIRLLAADISAIMQALQSRYAIHFNREVGRKGVLYQNRFKSPICGSDESLLQLIRYIHQNPIPSVVVSPEDWPWSSHNDYLRGGGGLSDPLPALALFGPDLGSAIAAYREFMGVPCPPDVLETIEGSLDQIEAFGRQDIEIPVTQRSSLQLLAEAICLQRGFSMVELRSASKRRDLCGARNDLIVAALYDGHRPSEIAAYLNRSQAVVNRALALKESKITKRLTPLAGGYGGQGQVD